MKLLAIDPLTILAAVLILTLFGSAAHKLSNKPHHTGKEEFVGHDDVLEDLTEDVVELITGQKKDFTPESPEE